MYSSRPTSRLQPPVPISHDLQLGRLSPLLAAAWGAAGSSGAGVATTGAGAGGGGVGVERSGLKSTPMASSRYRLVLRHRLVIPFLLRRSCRHLLHSYFIECFIIINTTSNSYPTAAEAAYTDAAAAVQREMLVRCEIEGLAGLRRYMLAFSMSGRHGRALTCCLVRTASLCGVPLGIPTRKRGELLVTRIEAGAVRSVRTFGCPPPGKHQSADHTTDHPPASHTSTTLL